MVSIIINKHDYKKKEIKELVMHQIEMLIEKASPRRDFLRLRLNVSVNEDDGYK